MVIKIDGKEIQDAVIRTQQMELRSLEIAQDRIEFEVKDIYGESFNCIPCFFKLAYSDGSVIAAKADQETPRCWPTKPSRSLWSSPKHFDSRPG